MKRRYSKQKEVVLQILASTKTHPTVQWVYEKAREVIPCISLGTVYRNLNLLIAEGSVRKVIVDDVAEHFDADTSSHHHFVCKGCGEVSDVEVDGMVQLRDDKYAVSNTDIQFYGTCNKCN